MLIITVLGQKGVSLQKQNGKWLHRGQDGNRYPWGNQVNCSFANYLNCVGDTTVMLAAIRKGVSPYGVLDMAGNVWEWVADFYGLELL